MSLEKRPQDPDEIREMVKEGYARVAERASSEEPPHAAGVGRRIGYDNEQLGAVPEGANLGPFSPPGRWVPAGGSSAST
jgi:hypothetical protein